MYADLYSFESPQRPIPLAPSPTHPTNVDVSPAPEIAQTETSVALTCEFEEPRKRQGAAGHSRPPSGPGSPGSPEEPNRAPTPPLQPAAVSPPLPLPLSAESSLDAPPQPQPQPLDAATSELPPGSSVSPAAAHGAAPNTEQAQAEAQGSATSQSHTPEPPKAQACSIRMPYATTRANAQ